MTIAPRSFPKRTADILFTSCIVLAGLTCSWAARAQTFASSSSGESPSLVSYEPALPYGAGGASTRGGVPPTVVGGIRPLSRIALGADISPLGIGFSAATNLNRHLNLRANGSLFNYTTGSFNTEGFNVTAKINLASARASVDYYPFHKGFRLSPGVMLHNDNQGTFNLISLPGQSFSLNGYNYYSATGANAVKGLGKFGLGNGSPAFTMTTGWGNSIPTSGRHLSFPFEIGVAFIQKPTLGMTLTGLECDQNGGNCVDVATNPDVQTNLNAQMLTYQNNIEQLKTYPIASFGVAYNFSVGRSRSM